MESPEGPKPLPTFEYHTRKGMKVFSGLYGIVRGMKYQPETDDYEISISPSILSTWFVSYDHVKNPKVMVFEWVKPGRLLGDAGDWDENSSRFEIMVGHMRLVPSRLEVGDVQLCPLLVADKSSRQEMERVVSRFMREWDRLSDNKYGDMLLPGCRRYAYFESEKSGIREYELSDAELEGLGE